MHAKRLRKKNHAEGHTFWSLVILIIIRDKSPFLMQSKKNEHYKIQPAPCFWCNKNKKISYIWL